MPETPHMSLTIPSQESVALVGAAIRAMALLGDFSETDARDIEQRTIQAVTRAHEHGAEGPVEVGVRVRSGGVQVDVRDSGRPAVQLRLRRAGFTWQDGGSPAHA